MKSPHDEVFITKPNCNFYWTLDSNCNILFLTTFFSIQISTSWNLEGNRNLFLNPSSEFGLHQVAMKTPETAPVKPTLTVGELHLLAHIETTDPNEEIFFSNWTINFGRRKVRVYFKTETDKLNIVVTVTDSICRSG